MSLAGYIALIGYFYCVCKALVAEYGQAMSIVYTATTNWLHRDTPRQSTLLENLTRLVTMISYELGRVDRERGA
jgi:hypothetical protein